jgi:hypothetical protein
MKNPATIFGFALIAFGVLMYLLFVGGVITPQKTSPSDIGLVTTSGILVVLGAAAVLLGRRAPATE